MLNYNILFFIIILVLTILFTYTNFNHKENFENKSCPNILLKKNNEIYLFNSNKAKIPGINPVKFNNLNDYIEFLNWERSQNINCPVLYLEQTFNPQGEITYKQKNLNQDSNFSLLLNATRNNPPYNKNMYPGFDPDNQYIGDVTPLDNMYHSKKAISANPMDTNWGGEKYTLGRVKKGDYKDDNVKIYVHGD